MEFVLGNKNGAMLQVFDGGPAARELLAELLEAPTLYDEFLRLPARTGLEVPEAVLTRDVREPWRFEAGLVPVFRRINESTPWDAYDPLGCVRGVREPSWTSRTTSSCRGSGTCSPWFRHLLTVQRTIGAKTVTGGSSWVGFLRRALDLTFFPELCAVRTEIGR